MKTRASKVDIEKLIEFAKSKGWTADDEKEYLKSGALWWHAITLKSPENKFGDWASILIVNPTRHPKLVTRCGYHRERGGNRGLWHAQYVIREFQCLK